MIHRRGVIPVVLLLFLVVTGFVVQAVTGPAAAGGGAVPEVDTRPSPDLATGTARQVVAALAAVKRAYDAGDTARLCRPGALVDRAVIRRENAAPGGCESRLERLMANRPRLRFGVRGLTLKPDLATATVATAGAAAVPVDLVRRGRHWLLSFSDGADPMPVLAGTE
jgi:hypothetical protein